MAEAPSRATSPLGLRCQDDFRCGLPHPFNKATPACSSLRGATPSLPAGLTRTPTVCSCFPRMPCLASERLALCPALHLRRQAYALPLAEAHGSLLQSLMHYARVLLRCHHAEALDNTLAPSCALAFIGVRAPIKHSLMPTTPKGPTRELTHRHSCADPRAYAQGSPHMSVVLSHAVVTGSRAHPNRQCIDRQGNRTPNTGPLRAHSVPPGRGLWLTHGFVPEHRHAQGLGLGSAGLAGATR